MEEKQTIFEDFKKIKGYILGVIAFATAVSVFFTQVLNLPIQPVLATVFIATICMLFIGFLIEKSEKRQRIALQKQEEKSVARVESFKESINEIKNLAIETRLDNLRTLLTLYMHDQPENHDTILKIAEKYFCEFHGDWVMTDEFLRWTDKENEAGRKVHIPNSLLTAVKLREQEEKIDVL